MRRALVLTAAASLVSVFAFRWWLPAEHRATPTLALPDTRFDYSLGDYQALFHDDQGRPELRIRGPRLEHDANSRTVRLDQPRFSLLDDSGAWEGRADHGEFQREESLLLLSGQVQLERATPTGPVRLETEALQHQRPARTISADVPVRLSRPGTELDAGGLMMHLDNETVEFSDDVQIEAHPAARRPRDPSGTGG
ncbi:LPS export ABC transporter periplasmic protein LptC [Wenzhouxiangella marina]|uniref:Uncharacterized protein n=1 Tax=Wenzhouxiangella marina TaxID=1579979 RepID=A0A0K0XTI0_9GAMM|nr:LPS export ABC transporter periplasmic protein LptC [Wenzhouxiangella marina]AKS41019.1 hypothetical protein WM2015_638 [Wenzhouxiangella marina]MBB6087897.1 lipopolysaccharide export system protein LptC [Wenzhouxiangella marina]